MFSNFSVDPRHSSLSKTQVPACLSVSVCNNSSPWVQVSTTQCNKMPNSYHIWHCRIGHANEMAVKHILTQCYVQHINKNLMDFCVPCCYGKSHCLPSQLDHLAAGRQQCVPKWVS